MVYVRKNFKRILRLFLLIIFTLPGAAASANYSDPSATITSPANNLVVVKNSVTVSGTVYHAGSLKVNGTAVSFSSANGSFSTNVTLTKRTNDINVTVFSGVYSATFNRTVYYSFDPTINITSHKTGTTVETSDVIIQGTTNMTDSSEIESFTINDVETTVTNGSFTSSPITLKRGDNDIKLVIKTTQINIPGDGVVPSKTATRTIKLKYSDLPIINISEPLEGSTVYTNTVNINGHLDRADDITTMKIDDKTVKVDSGSFDQTVTLKPGKNEIKLAVGSGEMATSKTLTVYYSTLAKSGSEVKSVVADGGDVKAFDDLIKIKFPKGSVDLNTTAILTVSESGQPGNTPAQSAFIGPVIQLVFDGEQPIKPFRVTLKYDAVVGDNQSHKVTVLYYNEDSGLWEILGGVVDAKAKTVSADIPKQGYIAAAMYYRSYDDVSSHWALRDIEFLTAKGAITEPGQYFRPNAQITRAEFVTFLVKALGIQPYDPEAGSYIDVGRELDCYKYIEAALRAGIISGVKANEFAPDRYIVREEAGVIMARAGNLKQVKEQELTKVFGAFKDESKISLWARKELAAAIKAKVINGNESGSFVPRKYTTRAEAAAMISRLTEVVKKTK